MKNFDFSDRKSSRRKQLENKKQKPGNQNYSDDAYVVNRLKKEFKNKKNEIRAEELWEDWEDSDE